jgi:hypothetical protein
MVESTAKSQVLTQRRKAAKILNQFHLFTQFLIFFAPERLGVSIFSVASSVV